MSAQAVGERLKNSFISLLFIKVCPPKLISVPSLSFVFSQPGLGGADTAGLLGHLPKVRSPKISWFGPLLACGRADFGKVVPEIYPSSQ